MLFILSLFSSSNEMLGRMSGYSGPQTERGMVAMGLAAHSTWVCVAIKCLYLMTEVPLFAPVDDAVDCSIGTSSSILSSLFFHRENDGRAGCLN